MTNSDLPTIDEAIKRALAKVNGPIDKKEFISNVLKIRPSSSRHAVGNIRNNLDHFEGDVIAHLDKKTIVPLRLVMSGIRFRIPLSPIEVKQGALIIDPSFKGFLHENPEDIKLIDEQGNPLPINIVNIKLKSVGIFGEFEYESKAFDLGAWLKDHKARKNDSIIVTVESWQPKCFKLELESSKEGIRRQNEINARNQELGDIIFDMLENSASEALDYKKAIPASYLRLPDPKGYPGDHWLDVLQKDPRMWWDGIWIKYIENRGSLESFITSQKPTKSKNKKTIDIQGSKQVYRFKAAFKHRPNTWRVIDIQGKNTLSDFDDVLRTTFKHDRSDHLSGFWKQIRRGSGGRFREVDLGDINPFGGGSAADTRIVELELNIGDKMRYVYDFGDWVEHEITLEAIDEPDSQKEYPCVVERSKQRQRYCENCKSKSKKTVAKYVCIECSEEEERQVLVCEDCLMEYHEEHYAEEIVD